MNLVYQRVLVLAPHTDDGEIGCGGAIAKFISEGKEVVYVAFSSARKSLREQGRAEDLLINEVSAATSVLGIKENNLIIHDFNVREFPDNRQLILDELIKLKKEFDPQLVFCPSINDIHQDHNVVARECLRAFKNITILGYEEPWNNIEFETRVFIKLDQASLDKKIEALACYKSQKHRKYLNKGFMQSLATVRGVQIESELAESFEIVRLVV
jgi:N-acetylglucosamine malate deacetylase 1